MKSEREEEEKEEEGKRRVGGGIVHLYSKRDDSKWGNVKLLVWALFQGVKTETHMCYGAHVEVKVQLAGFGFFFHHTVPSDEAQVYSFGNKYLYLPRPLCAFSINTNLALAIVSLKDLCRVFEPA